MALDACPSGSVEHHERSRLSRHSCAALAGGTPGTQLGRLSQAQAASDEKTCTHHRISLQDRNRENLFSAMSPILLVSAKFSARFLRGWQYDSDQASPKASGVSGYMQTSACCARSCCRNCLPARVHLRDAMEGGPAVRRAERVMSDGICSDRRHVTLTRAHGCRSLATARRCAELLRRLEAISFSPPE